MAQRKTLSVQMPRQLVHRLDAVAEESFGSFVDRLARLHGTALGTILSRLGMITEDNQKTLIGYGVTMTSFQIQRFAFVAGIPEAVVEDMLLGRFSPGIIQLPSWNMKIEGPSVHHAARSEWAYFSGSHFCPQCLRESNGVWSSRWKLPWSFVCVRHRIFLHDTCPACQRRPRVGLRDGRLYPAFHGQVSTPTRCNNALIDAASGRGQAGRPCGQPFTDLIGTEASTEILVAQLSIDETITQVLLLPDDERRSHDFFSELRSVSALLLYAAEVEDFQLTDAIAVDAVQAHIEERDAVRKERSQVLDGRNGPRQRTYIGVPTNSALMAALVQTALPIMTTRSPKQLSERFRVLADRVQARSPKSRWNVAEYFQLSSRLKVALDQCAEARSTFDRRSGVKSTSTMAHGPYCYLPEHVPQLFPAEPFQTLFQHLFPKFQENLVRRFCSMAAVKLLGFTWSEAGQALELPATADRQANHIITHLNRSKQYEAFSSALHQWASQSSAATTRVNHQELRDALRSTHDFSLSVWTALCEQGLISAGRLGSRSRYAAAWMWADATGGDWTLSPAFNGASNANQREVYKAMTKLFGPPMRRALQAEAQLRITRYQTDRSRKK